VNLYMHVFAGTMLIIGSVFALLGAGTLTLAMFDSHARPMRKEIIWLVVAWVFIAALVAATATWWITVKVPA
jgi:hypothetical protein